MVACAGGTSSHGCASEGAALIALAAALVLSGCSGSQIGERLPTSIGGLPQDAPERPTAEQAYPAVHNMPPTRTNPPLSDEQQKHLQDDLVAARNRYGAGSNVPPKNGSTSGSTSGSTAGSTGNASGGSAANP